MPSKGSPNWIVPTAPFGTANNQAASTLFATKGASSVNPVAFGADPTGVNDSAPALNAALAVSNYIKFPSGHFIFKSKITYTTVNGNGGSSAAVTIEGGGPGVTVLDWNNSTDGLEINAATVNLNAVIRSLTIATNQVAGGVALTLKLTVLNSNAATERASLISNVAFRGNATANAHWLTNINLQNVSNIIVEDCFILGASHTGTGIVFIGNVGLSSPAISLAVLNTEILSTDIGIRYDALAQGLFVFNTNLTDVNTGIFIPSSIAALTQLLISNCQINPTTSGIGVDLESTCSAVCISNTLIIVGIGGIGLKYVVAEYFTVIGCAFAATSTGSGTGVLVTATAGTTTGGSIIGNQITGLAAGISLGTTTDLLAITGNTLTLNTAAITSTSTGTHNVIKDNPGYNPIGVTAAANVGVSPATITAGPSPETHYVRQNGTNTATIAKGSQQIAALVSATTYYPIELGPNESYIVTWATTQPTYTKDVH